MSCTPAGKQFQEKLFEKKMKILNTKIKKFIPDKYLLEMPSTHAKRHIKSRPQYSNF